MATFKPWVLFYGEGDGPTTDFATVEQAHEAAEKWAEAATGNMAIVRIGFQGGDVCHVKPAVGQKVSITVGSDRYAHTISRIAPHGKTIYISRGEGDEGFELQARKTPDGYYKLWGSGYKGYVNFVSTKDYQDPSF